MYTNLYPEECAQAIHCELLHHVSNLCVLFPSHTFLSASANISSELPPPTLIQHLCSKVGCFISTFMNMLDAVAKAIKDEQRCCFLLWGINMEKEGSWTVTVTANYPTWLTYAVNHPWQNHIFKKKQFSNPVINS